MLTYLLTLLAQDTETTGGIIQNPVLQETEGAYGAVAANPLAPLIARLWQTIVVAGALMVIVMLVWGALDWLMSEGDPEKLKNAKNKIIHTMFGIGLLAASFAVVWFIRTLFGFDLLKLAWPTPGGAPAE